MWSLWISLLFLLTVNVNANHECNKKIVCYYANWAQHQGSPYRFTPEDIDPTLCTHLLFAFAKVSYDRTTVSPYEANDFERYAEVIALKKRNPALKVMLAVGGWTHGPGPFSQMAATDSSIDVWTDNVISYLRTHGFDGLDLDWEYPAGREGGRVNDKYRFTALLQRTRDAFKREALRTGRAEMLLAAAVNSGRHFSDPSYEKDKIGSYVDFLSVMTYDMHGTWDRVAGHHSQLGGSTEENTKFAMNYWIQGGVERSKLVLGLATYGRSFRLAGSQTTPGSAISGGGTPGRYTHESGFLASYEICQLNKNAGWSVEWMSRASVPYSHGHNEWVGFDDERSFKAKAQYAKDEGLGGAMIWALHLDDFNGLSCGQGKYPLVSAVKREFCPGNSISKVDDAESTQQTTEPTDAEQTTEPTTPPTFNKVEAMRTACVVGEWQTEWQRDPVDCAVFHRCVKFTASFHAMYTYTCPLPHLLAFDPETIRCEWRANVSC